MQKGNIIYFFFFPLTHTGILVAGVGSTEPDDGENEDEPGELANAAWMQLLDMDDGIFSLKPWQEVCDLKANKVNIALAFREVLRQAWSSYVLFSHYSLCLISVI